MNTALFLVLVLISSKPRCCSLVGAQLQPAEVEDTAPVGSDHMTDGEWVKSLGGLYGPTMQPTEMYDMVFKFISRTGDFTVKRLIHIICFPK